MSRKIPKYFVIVSCLALITISACDNNPWGSNNPARGFIKEGTWEIDDLNYGDQSISTLRLEVTKWDEDTPNGDIKGITKGKVFYAVDLYANNESVYDSLQIDDISYNGSRKAWRFVFDYNEEEYRLTGYFKYVVPRNFVGIFEMTREDENTLIYRPYGTIDIKLKKV
ncbi:MAG: hypothetical protein LUB56_00650 [Coprobacillus sp.]|nr:hypothetical protein [Coprobacillus sp.]